MSSEIVQRFNLAATIISLPAIYFVGGKDVAVSLPQGEFIEAQIVALLKK
jgi:hypothetical protein